MSAFSIGDGVDLDDPDNNPVAQQLLEEAVDAAVNAALAEPEPAHIIGLKHAVLREAYELFVTHFGPTPTDALKASVAPGRVNLIGEHIDYCDGFVLPMAIPLYTAIVGKEAEDKSRGYSKIFSSIFKETVNLSIPYNILSNELPTWSRYVQGVLSLMCSTTPFDIVIHSHLPMGSGLSSSAALELSTYMFASQFCEADTQRMPVEYALLCQKAEHEYANVPCGIMDQFVISLAQHGQALKIDCRSLESDAIPMGLMHDAIFLVTNSGVKHALAGGEYAKRKAAVDLAVKLIGVPSWRDVSSDLLRTKSSVFEDKEGLVDHADHVVGEIERTVRAAEALLDNNIIQFGKLMTESHISLRDKYRVSCTELDELVELALETEGVFGSRMTGGGFGGCTVTLVRRENVERLKEHIKNNYSGGHVSFHECEPVGGASTSSLDFLNEH